MPSNIAHMLIAYKALQRIQNSGIKAYADFYGPTGEQVPAICEPRQHGAGLRILGEEARSFY